jgi:surface polysaccharide O-acyltransferase-like enzyme
MVFWIIAYFVFRGAFLKQDLTLNGIAVDLFNATPFVHLYYLYVIAGLYLVAPIIGAFTAQASRFALVMAATAMLAVPVLESLLRFWLGTRSGGVTGLSYWVPYLGYFIAGRAFRGFRLSGRLQVTISLLIACVITFQIVSLYLLARASVPIGYPLGYFSVFTVGSSLLIYVLAAQDSPGQFRLGAISKVMASLSIATFGVYLAHEMLLRWYGRTVGSGAGNHLATALIPTYVVAVVGTFALVLLARRIPIVRSVF